MYVIKQNLIGKKYGLLTILDSKFEKSRTYFLCKCDCGNEKWIRADSIKKGNQKSCGCLMKKTQFKKNNLKGKRFGRLVAIKEVGQKEGKYLWECKCDCGNINFVLGTHLISGNTKSCGCLQHEKILENREKAVKSHLEKNIIENTNISLISRKNTMRHNTSGVTGVSWDGSRHKWVAQITFKKKHYNLGRFDKKEDAINARKDAEERLHKEFLREKELID